MTATEFIRKFFVENPKASVNDCAREMDKVKVEGTFDTGLISRIRMKERQKTVPAAAPVIPDKGKPLFQPPIVRKKEWRDNQTWWRDTKPKEVEKVEEKVEAPKEVTPPESESITTKKRRFVNSYVEKLTSDELAKQTCHSVQEAVKKEFTTGLDFKYVAETLRIAKEMANIPMKRATVKKKAPTQKAAKSVSKKVTKTKDQTEQSFDRIVSWGSNNFKILPEERVRSFVGDLLMGTGEDATMTDPATIRVWKPVPSKIRLQIDIG